jgi:hypothetical protein
MTNTPLKPNRRHWRWRIAGGVVALLAINWCLASSSFIPPRDLTETVMAVLEQRIRLAVDRRLDIPDDLNDLPPIAGKLSDTTDAWGRPIILERTGAEVTLVSLGKDGRPGGFSHDTDVIHRFTLKD